MRYAVATYVLLLRGAHEVSGVDLATHANLLSNCGTTASIGYEAASLVSVCGTEMIEFGAARWKVTRVDDRFGAFFDGNHGRVRAMLPIPAFPTVCFGGSVS